ncbi:MAG: bifunctional DNA-formamidopyrimidine glycosylase/DNA-(apurinic or apyrimidinic site) lyase [Gemmatimonadales bacterium]
MPELPEVETIVRGVAPRLTGRRLLNPRLAKTDVLRKVSRARLLRTIARNRVESVSRRAKHVVILFSSGHRLVIQPRMTGTLTIHEGRLRPADRRYGVLEARIEGGGTLLYSDVRRLGTLSLLDQKGWASYTALIGPEPLGPGFDERRLAERLSGTRQAVKKALMDQRRVAGIGNIYANEALFRAGIDPSKPAHRLTRGELGSLYRAVRSVLGEAIARGGTTVRDYRTATGDAGGFQHSLLVYGRAGEPCVWCRSPLATTRRIDGRATTFCRHCQR